MPLFHIKHKIATRIQPQEQRFRESVIHHLIETNLGRFFEDLIFVASKPRIGGKEFDSLALNRATKVPVIVEYKREKDRSVVEQVSLYYVKLKNNKADVLMLLGKQNEVALDEIDFDNPEIFVVAKEFTSEQRELLGMMHNYLRLFRYQLYADSIVSLESVEPLGPAATSAGRATARRQVLVSGDLERFGMTPETRKLYEQLDRTITGLDSSVKPGKVNKYYIGYGATGSYFCSVKPRVSSIRVEVKLSRRPPRSHVTARPIEKYFHTPMTHVFQITAEREIGQAKKMIKAALEDSM